MHVGNDAGICALVNRTRSFVLVGPTGQLKPLRYVATCTRATIVHARLARASALQPQPPSLGIPRRWFACLPSWTTASTRTRTCSQTAAATAPSRSSHASWRRCTSRARMCCQSCMRTVRCAGGSMRGHGRHLVWTRESQGAYSKWQRQNSTWCSRVKADTNFVL